MPFVYAIGFVICYFVFDLSWWMSLLIAFAAPAILGLVMFIVGVPITGAIVGIGTLVNKIKERRQRSYYERNDRDTLEIIEQEDPLVTEAENLIDKRELQKESNVFGTGSLVLGIIGIFWWPAVLGIIAIALGAIQWRRHINKRSIAGFTLGIVDILLAVLWYTSGLMPTLF